MSKTIKIKKYVDIIEEYPAAAAVSPGMLVELTSANTVQAHSTAAGRKLTMVALEDELQGNTINDAYAEGDPVQVWVPNRGEQAQMILGAGQNASIGSLLVSNADGTLKVAGGSDTEVVAVALEAVDVSASGADDAFIKVRIY